MGLGLGTSRAETVTVFAAASTKGALDAVAQSFAEGTGHRAVVSYAGSSALARQIQRGAPADVFVSANVEWMDVLVADNRIAPGTRHTLASNRLVVIGPGETGNILDLTNRAAWDAALGDGRLAMAFVEAVPAGIYGRLALKDLDLWNQVASQVAQTDNVRAALALVALGEAPLGIVYATDAQAEPRVHVKAVFPETSHPPVTYPVAIVAGRARPEVVSFMDHLLGPHGRAALAEHGFLVSGD